MNNEVKHTPTPWKATKYHESWTVRRDADESSVPIAEMWETIFSPEANAAHIVKCVNLHDELVERLEEAQKAISTLLLVTVGITPTETMVQETINEAADYTISGKIREVLKKAGAL